MKKNIFIILSALVAAGCWKGNDISWKTDVVAVVVNEGDEGAKNGSIDFYDEAQNTLGHQKLYILNSEIKANIYSAPLMDGNSLWLICHNPDKIMTFNLLTGYSGITSITDSLQNPRQFAMYISDRDYYGTLQLFVTNRGAAAGDGSYPNSYVQVYETPLIASGSGISPKQRLSCGPDAEGIVIVDRKIYVATGAGVKVFNVNSLDEAPKTLAYSAEWGAAKQFVSDSLNNLWVSYSNGKVQYINTKNVERVKEYDISLDATSGNIALTRNGKYIVSFAVQDYGSVDSTIIYRTDVATGAPSEVLFKGEYKVRAIGVNRLTGRIYAADDTRSNGKSALLLIKEDGALVHRQETSIGTKQFRFFAITYAL
jgi:hypothetical protein